MTIVDELKAEIDAMDYTELLRNWRFAPPGTPYFSGEIGEYYADSLTKRRAEVGPAAHTAASKAIGWEQPK